MVAFGGNRTSGSIEVAPALLAQPGSGWRGDFESETFVTHSLRGEGFDASEDGTGRGTPLVPVGVTLHGTDGTQSVASFTDLSSSLRARIPSGVENSTTTAVLAHAFDARQSDVIQYGDKTGPLDTCGHSVGVMQPVTYDLFNVTAPVNRQNRQPGDPCHTLARSNAEHAAVVQATALQDVRGLNKAQNGRGWNDDGTAYTVDTHATQGVAVAVDTYNGAITGDLAATISARNGIPDATGPRVMTAMQVRRLTPVECERLQGFPDDYTAIPWRGKPASECPDGPRYKALGNSWAVPCVRWIGRRIAERIA